MRNLKLKRSRMYIFPAAASALLLASFVSEFILFDGDKLRKKHTDYKTDFQQFSIFYPEDKQDLLPIVEQALVEAEDKNQSLLGNYTDAPVDIEIFNSRENFEEAAGSSGEGYYTDEEKYMAVLFDSQEDNLIKNEKLSAFQSTLVHEYTHYVFHQKLHDLSIDPELFPLWFHEGVSEYTGQDSYIHKNIEMVSFTDLTDPLEWEKAKSRKNGDIYGQSFLAVYYLIENYGENIIKEILIETKKNNQFDEGFYEATGFAEEDLENILQEEFPYDDMY